MHEEELACDIAVGFRGIDVNNINTPRKTRLQLL